MRITHVLSNAGGSLTSPRSAAFDMDGHDIENTDELHFKNASADPAASTSPRLRNNAGALKVRVQDARTNTTARPFGVIADTSGSPAAGLGVGMLFEAESADEAPSSFMALDAVATDVTAGSEDSVFAVLLRVAGRALDEKYRFASTAGDGFGVTLTHAASADRTLTLPDATGTVALTSDIPASSLTGLTSIQFVRKTSDETVNGSSTLQNDDALLAALAANEVVTFQCFVIFDAAQTADIKFAFTVPAAATIAWNAAGGVLVDDALSATRSNAVTTSGGALAWGGYDAGTKAAAMLTGTVVNGANAGNLQLQWAQNTSNGSDAKVYANSWLLVERV